MIIINCSPALNTSISIRFLRAIQIQIQILYLWKECVRYRFLRLVIRMVLLHKHAIVFLTRPVSSAGQSLGLAKQSGGGVLVGPFYSVGHSTGQVCNLLALTSRSWASRYPGLHLLRRRVASSSKPKCFVHSPSSR